MNIILLHPFRFTGPWDKLLEGVDNLEKFIRKIERHCDANTEHLSDDSQKNKRKNKFRGDAFEVFAEFLIKSHPYDRRIGISSYITCDSSDDYGIDGYGIGTNLNNATVQIKYRSDRKYELTANDDHLTNFLGASQNHLTRPVNNIDTENMLIITTAKGLDRVTKDKLLHNKVRCLGRNDLKQFVDNNLPFWQEFKNATQLPTKPI